MSLSNVFSYKNKNYTMTKEIGKKYKECGTTNNLNKFMKEKLDTIYFLFDKRFINNYIFFMFLKEFIEKEEVKRNYDNIINEMDNLTYRKKLSYLKEKYKNDFILWMCNIEIYLIDNKKESDKIVKIIKENGSENCQKIIEFINKIASYHKLGDFINFYLMFGLLLYIYKVENYEEYKRLNKNELLLKIENLFKNFNEIKPFIIIIKNNCQNYEKVINNENDCYLALLNRSYFIVSEISELKNVGNNININKYFENKNVFYIENWSTNRKENKNGMFNKLFKSTSTNEIINILYSENNKIIFSDKLEYPYIKINVICNEVNKTNNYQNFGDNVISINLKDTNKNIGEIYCLGNEIEKIEIINDNNDILIKYLGKIKYGLIKDKNYIYLLNLCDHIVKIKNARFTLKDNQIHKIEVVNIDPKEFVVISLLSFYLKRKEGIIEKIGKEIKKEIKCIN